MKKRYIMASNESGDFLRYSESSVAPTSHGRIFHFFGKVCTKGIMDNAVPEIVADYDL
jgi:hypothetical protein